MNEVLALVFVWIFPVAVVSILVWLAVCRRSPD